MQEELKALEVIKTELKKIQEKYQKKTEKERAKVNEVYVVVQGEKYYSESEINDWYQNSYITEKQCDKYIEKLQNKLSSAGEYDSLTTSERICKMLDNTIMDYVTEIFEIKQKEEKESKRKERWEIAQQQGCSYIEWLQQEEVSRQSVEYEKLMGVN